MIPRISILDDNLADKIIDEAITLLNSTGVMVEYPKALEYLYSSGCHIDGEKVKIPPQLVESSLRSAPGSYKLYDRSGYELYTIGLDNIFFNPGSAALYILEPGTGKIRRGLSKDIIEFVKLTDSLENIDFQSTGVIPSDIPEKAADQFRLYLALMLSSKPVITGTFEIGNFEIMRKMLTTVRGSEDSLREKPLAIFDCCPSQPLKWSELTCHDLIECAKYGIPAQLISMPLSGGTAPVTLAGTLVQHTAETLSGIVIHQCVNPGAPINYGGSPAIMDMRNGSSPMGAIETAMIDAAYATIGRKLGLPTHTYLCMSDSKIPDAQAGLESGIGAVMAGLAGVNIVSGPGMLNFENCQSMEKLVIDNEIAGMVKRLLEGIKPRETPLASELEGCHDGVDFLASDLTFKWFRKEQYFPGSVIDRGSIEGWIDSGATSARDRASKIAENLITSYVHKPLAREIANSLKDIEETVLKSYGIDKIPVDLIT